MPESVNLLNQRIAFSGCSIEPLMKNLSLLKEISECILIDVNLLNISNRQLLSSEIGISHLRCVDLAFIAHLSGHITCGRHSSQAVPTTSVITSITGNNDDSWRRRISLLHSRNLCQHMIQFLGKLVTLLKQKHKRSTIHV